MSPDDILAAIAACFCELLEDTVGGAPATCCLTAGRPSIPDCCAGYAWVRLTGAYPTVAFPAIESRPTNCYTSELAIQVEIGITRCAPAPCDQLSNTCCDAEAAAQAILMDDWKAARKLFQCGCIGLPKSAIVIGPMKTYGPEGGCIGFSMTATLRADNI